MIVALIQFDSSAHVFAVLGVFVAGQIMEGSVITPKLVGSKVGLHPLWIIFGMLSGAALFGFVGILIAVPVTAVTGVLVRFATARYLQSPLYSKTN
jgi:predicted PurR-regulated permease PerM